MSDGIDSEKVLSTFERLTAHFATSEHATVKKGGSEQTYAPWTEYVERLNAVLEQGWSFRVIREGFTPTECWVLGEITATIDGVETVRQQYGCEPIAVGQSPNGDLLKKAASDAVKKAASLLGIGLYLSIKEEREAVKAAMRAEVQAEIKRQEEERKANRPKAPATTTAATSHPGSQAGPSASTPSAPSVTPSSSSTTATDVEKAAVLTGAPERLHQRWERLVAEAERVKLPTLGRIKAIDPKAVGEAQLKKYADQLEERLYEVREATGAA